MGHITRRESQRNPRRIARARRKMQNALNPPLRGLAHLKRGDGARSAQEPPSYPKNAPAVRKCLETPKRLEVSSTDLPPGQGRAHHTHGLPRFILPNLSVPVR
ncbi:hypothetical protein NDU88_005987 [Pleurodeles waltl]|uniref:Uncharacterized protein n=1 Tax=Pleurodeles waltl TaxID=8319 RepID=A0AAV7TCV9_PLEWA|nr:hypothetical protein NDU88_005987 [Pleurodeles waltl]